MTGTGDDAGRLALEALESLGMPYEIMECDPELADTAAFCEHNSTQCTSSVVECSCESGYLPTHFRRP